MVEDEGEAYDPSRDDVVRRIMSEGGARTGGEESEHAGFDGRPKLDDADGAVNPHIDWPRPQVRHDHVYSTYRRVQIGDSFSLFFFQLVETEASRSNKAGGGASAPAGTPRSFGRRLQVRHGE